MEYARALKDGEIVAVDFKSVPVVLFTKLYYCNNIVYFYHYYYILCIPIYLYAVIPIHVDVARLLPKPSATTCPKITMMMMSLCFSINIIIIIINKNYQKMIIL